MKTALVLLLFCSSLWSNCTQPQIQKAQTLYNQVEQTQNPKEQIEFLLEALGSCYSAEIEANLFILQAQNSEDVLQEISYYKQALVSISKFQEQNLILGYQNELNLILANLYEPIDEEISKIYRSKVLGVNIKEKSKRFEYGVYFLFFLLIAWAFLEFFRKK